MQGLSTYITDQPIGLDGYLSKVPHPSCGAVSTFMGVVRNHQNGKCVKTLYYECYQTMAEKQIRLIVDRIRERWSVHDIFVQHRIGWLEVGEIAVVIAVHSAHRDEAFAACRSIIDEIKRTVPIWKKEVYEDDTSEWVYCPHAEEVVK